VTLSEIFPITLIFEDTAELTRSGMIDAMLDELADAGHIESNKRADIRGAIEHREELGPIAIGAGVAIPHARLPFLSRIVGAVAVSRRPIDDWIGLDGDPVDVILLVLFPPVSGGKPVDPGVIFRHLRSESFRQALRKAVSPQELAEVLQQARDPAM
jgi:nitrogen PTS system EIIA component